jgi:hypothetical protein
MSAALSAVLPVALLLGLSPVLREWALHLLTEPATRYVLLSLVLLVHAVWHAPREPARLGAGLPWIVAAILVELVASAGGLDRYGRLALPLGIVGGLRATGLAPTRVAALAFFIVPVPRFLAQLALLDPQRWWAGFAETLVPGSAEPLGLDHWDSGMRLAGLLAGLGWFAGLRLGDTGRALFLRSGGFALSAVVFQAVGVALAAALCAAGATGLARAWLLHGLWITTGALTLWLVIRRTPAAGPEAGLRV